jgi:ribosomal protein L14E/L6E/L27E
MNVTSGMVAKAVAGRENGSFFLITAVKDGFVFIADGKERKLEKPKMKSLKHIRLTKMVIDMNDITNKKLKKILSEINGTSEI